MIDTPKTVYDPKIISDEQIIEWGKEAMNSPNAVRNGRIVESYANNGLKFRGFINENQPNEIKNFFPLLDL